MMFEVKVTGETYKLLKERAINSGKKMWQVIGELVAPKKKRNKANKEENVPEGTNEEPADEQVTGDGPIEDDQQ